MLRPPKHFTLKHFGSKHLEKFTKMGVAFLPQQKLGDPRRVVLVKIDEHSPFEHAHRAASFRHAT